MKIKQRNSILSAVFVLLAVTLACSGGATPEPTSVPPTDTPLPTATPTQIPTSTPRPTATPNLAATQQADETMSRVRSYVDQGYLQSTDGRLVRLDDYKREMALMDYLDFNFAGIEDLVQDFAVWADVKWENAAPVGPAHHSGCGFSFRIDPNNSESYTAMLTNDRVLLTYCGSKGCFEMGKTLGSGRLKLGNPAQAFMEMVVTGSKAFVLVDGRLIGEYTLFKEKLSKPGYLYYSIISGTNHDYGVRCEISNSNLWIVK